MQTHTLSTELLEEFADKSISSHKTKCSKGRRSKVQLAGESYRDTHNIGRRKSNASVVTYSLNSHLFFDVYAKFDQQNVVRINGAVKTSRKSGRGLSDKNRTDAGTLVSPVSGNLSTDPMSNHDCPSHQSSPRKLHVFCDALPVHADETLIPSPELDTASPSTSPRKARTFPMISATRSSPTNDHSDWGEVPPTITETFQRILDNKTVFKKHLSRTTVRKTAVKSKMRAKVKRKPMMRLCKLVKQPFKVNSHDDDEEEDMNCQIVLAKRNGMTKVKSNLRTKVKIMAKESKAPRERRMASLNAAAIINCVQSFLGDGRRNQSKSDGLDHDPEDEIDEEDIRLELVTDREEECADGDGFTATASKTSEVLDGTRRRKVVKEEVKAVKRKYTIGRKVNTSVTKDEVVDNGKEQVCEENNTRREKNKAGKRKYVVKKRTKRVSVGIDLDEDNDFGGEEVKVEKRKYAFKKRSKNVATDSGCSVEGRRDAKKNKMVDKRTVVSKGRDKGVKKKCVFRRKGRPVARDTGDIVEDDCNVVKVEEIGEEDNGVMGNEVIVKRKCGFSRRSNDVDRGIVEDFCDVGKVEEIGVEVDKVRGKEVVLKKKGVFSRRSKVGARNIVEDVCGVGKVEEIDEEVDGVRGKGEIEKMKCVLSKSNVVARDTGEMVGEYIGVYKVSELGGENDDIKRQEKILKREYIVNKKMKRADKDSAMDAHEINGEVQDVVVKRRGSAAKRARLVTKDNDDVGTVFDVATTVKNTSPAGHDHLDGMSPGAANGTRNCGGTLHSASLSGDQLVSAIIDDVITEIVAKDEYFVKRETVAKMRHSHSKRRDSGVKEHDVCVKEKNVMEHGGQCVHKREKTSGHVVIGVDKGQEERRRDSDTLLPSAANNSHKRDSNRFFDITSKVTQKDRQKMVTQRKKMNVSLVEQVFSTMEAQDQREHAKSCRNGPSSKKLVKSELEEEEQKTEVDDNAETLWLWHGESCEKTIQLQLDGEMETRTCYPAIRHANDDVVIRVLDCVMLRSGDHQPFLAKITAFYFDDTSGKKMMAVLWYYRPEHTDQGRLLWHGDADIYASKHLDTNSVDCIEDKAFVLPAELYCRFMTYNKRVSTSSRQGLTARMVPVVPDEAVSLDSDDTKSTPIEPSMAMFASHFYYTSNFQTSFPSEMTTSNVFVCRGLYDIHQHKVTKNVLQMIQSPVKEQPERCRSVDSAMSISSCNSDLRVDYAAAVTDYVPSSCRPNAATSDKSTLLPISCLVTMLPHGHAGPRRALLPSPSVGLKLHVPPSVMVQQHNGH